MLESGKDLSSGHGSSQSNSIRRSTVLLDHFQSEAKESTEVEQNVVSKLSNDALALSSAGIGALSCLLILMLLLAMLSSILYVMASWLAGYIFAGLVLAEVGLTVFLIQSAFLLRGPIIYRFFSSAVAAFFVVCQIAFYTQGYGIAGSLPALSGMAVTGWFLQRITGASLSLGGSEVFQRPLSIRDILAIAPLMLLMGLVPTLVAVYFDGVPSGAFAQMVIYYSLVIGLACATLIASCYGLLILVGFKRPALIRTLSIMALGLMVVAGFEAAFSDGRLPQMTISIVSGLACFETGVFAGYLPFHLLRFRPVWAKRVPIVESSQDVSFDDIVA